MVKIEKAWEYICTCNISDPSSSCAFPHPRSRRCIGPEDGPFPVRGSTGNSCLMSLYAFSSRLTLLVFQTSFSSLISSYFFLPGSCFFSACKIVSYHLDSICSEELNEGLTSANLNGRSPEAWWILKQQKTSIIPAT